MIRLDPQAILLPIEEYFKSINFFEKGRNAGIETDQGTGENYFFLETYLDKNLCFEHDSDYNNIIDVDYLYQQTPQKIHYKLELWGIGNAGKYDAFVFKPWAMGINNQAHCRLLENFVLYIPSTFFLNFLSRLIFMNVINISKIRNTRVLEILPNEFLQNFGLDHELLNTKIISNEILIHRVSLDYVFESEIEFFYENNWDGLSETLKTKYFEPLQNVWYKMIPLKIDEFDRLDLDQDAIGYLRLYQDPQSFSGGFGIEYIIDKAYRNKGYAKLMVNKIIQHLKDYSYCINISAEVNEDNLYSKQLLNSLGFEQQKAINLFGNYNFSLSLIDNFIELEKQDKAKKIEFNFRNEYYEVFDRYY